MHDPIGHFKDVWQLARAHGALPHRNAVCLSTLDADGYPSARFVDLKVVDASGFVFCTHLDSRKAGEIGIDPRAGLTMWWEHVSTQIRIKGLCEALSEQEADAHWSERLRDAQVATVTFKQSHPIGGLDALAEQYARARVDLQDEAIARPAHWGGFRLRPTQIEFLAFKETRLHERTVYTEIDGRWDQSFLQP